VIGAGPRVLIDATAVPTDRGGVGRYVDGLVGGLSSLDADFAVACQARDAERYGELAPGARILPAPPAIARRPARLVWEQTALPRVAERVGAQVIHSPHYTMPLRASRPVVVTLHDATFFTEPSWHGVVKARFFRKATRTALARAARCLVPSEATRDEVVRVLGADPSRIDVAHHGVDPRTFHVPDDDERKRARDRVCLDGEDYVAFLGTLEPRKNVPGLVRGWVQACADRKEAPALVLAGGAGWDTTLDEAIREVPPHLRVVRPGYLPVADLSGFLGGATVVAYPSHGEGFGLPVLEAMACGAPVLTTTRLSLPEVGGDAVAYADPEPTAIGAALQALLDDPARRALLGSAGLQRSSTFTWEASAERHVASYARAVSTP
jgi:glycosyltransferase involved in cell wall biosynthesis